MVDALKFLTAFSTCLFAGAALYINVAEHPARMALDTANALRQWAPSYGRATLMQAPLAIIGFACGTGAWLLGAGLPWLVAAVLIGMVVPFTFLVIMPTNRQLLDPSRDSASNQTRDLLAKWARLHAVRTVLSFAAAALAIYLSLRE